MRPLIIRESPPPAGRYGGLSTGSVITGIYYSVAKTVSRLFYRIEKLQGGLVIARDVGGNAERNRVRSISLEGVWDVSSSGVKGQSAWSGAVTFHEAENCFARTSNKASKFVFFCIFQ